MESAGDTPTMQPWETYFPALSFIPHIGQREAYEHAAADPIGDALIVLPTGYGKTRVGLGWYLIRRQRGEVNRCLWIVSSDEQRRGLAPEPDRRTGQREPTISDRAMTWFGLSCAETVAADWSIRGLRMHRTNRAEIFVTTYQALREQRMYFRQLMDDGDGQWRWQVFGDEGHHLSEQGQWADWLEDLTRIETVYMSATPLRCDRRPLKNVPSREDNQGRRTYEARVERTWQEAIDEHAIRLPQAHVEEWQLEFTDDKGDLVRVTTSELKEFGLKDGEAVDAWAVQNKLRYTMSYLQKLFADAVDCLNEKRARWPGRHQMIVFAMSCRHAKFLANEVFNKLDLGVEADWVGVGPDGRSEEVNRSVMSRFRAGRLTVLVQVDKVGEGFDHPPCSVGLFLNHFQSPTKLLQELGRLLRRDFEIPWEEDRADAFASADHPIHEVIEQMQPADNGYSKDGKPRDVGEGPAPRLLPDLSDILAEWLSTTMVLPAGHTPRAYDPGVVQAAERFDLTPEQVSEIVRVASSGVLPANPVPPSGEVGRQAFLQDRVDRAMSSIASSVIRLRAEGGRLGSGRAAGRLAGQVKKNLNARWKSGGLGHDAMLSEDFDQKYKWLKGIHDEVVTTRQVPSWLTEEW